jgi:hypothetical protein
MPDIRQLQEASRIPVTGGVFLSVFVSDETMKQLEGYAANNDTWGPNVRTPEDLAEAAIAEAALRCTR